MAQQLLEKRMRGWLHEAEHDVLGLWQLCGAAHEDWGAKTAEDVKALVLAFVRDLLTNGVKAINVSDGQPWPDQRPDVVIERISREWDALGREPDVPDIVWF